MILQHSDTDEHDAQVKILESPKDHQSLQVLPRHSQFHGLKVSGELAPILELSAFFSGWVQLQMNTFTVLMFLIQLTKREFK